MHLFVDAVTFFYNSDDIYIYYRWRALVSSIMNLRVP
jgi:hypothetical protein